MNNSFSLRQLTNWCREHFGFEHQVIEDGAERLYDLPWIVMDSTLATTSWDWQPEHKLDDILLSIAEFAEKHPSWIDLSREL